MSSDEMTVRDLCARIPGANAATAAAARARLDRLAKPPGSLGALEPLIIRLAAITGQVRPEFKQPAILVAAGDHGVVAERVSIYPQSMTGQVVLNFLRGGAAINALAASSGARVVVVDAGVAADLPDHPGLRRASAGSGTRNLLREPAMTRADTAAAIVAGARIAAAEIDAGLDLLALGDIGIGSTTSAACLTSAFTGALPELTTGRGAGLDDARLEHKRGIVAAAIRRARPKPTDPLGTLAELGGFEIAALVGAALAAAARRTPVVLDGYITASAALAAVALAPNLRHSLIAGHRAAEPGHRVALEHLGLQPLLTLDMRLGEASGAALALPIIQAAARAMRDMATFEQAGADDKLAR
jgi:nicotinate-nucleotide--dimethylbenzimidazole phosphoribosyltransferase